jgi:hypothetical protein
MKRFISVLAVMAIMAAMVAASAVPAFAKGQSPCKGNQQVLTNITPVGNFGDDNMNGVACYSAKKGTFSDDRG